MATKNKAGNTNKKNPEGTQKTNAKVPTVKRDLLDSLDAFFEKRLNFFFWFGLVLTVIFSLFLFDVKVGPGGDDSAYILRAFDFVHGFKYPSFQGPLYPIVLSPFVAIFGINLLVLKFLSTIFIAVAAIFFYKSFRNRIPASLLVISFFLLSFNYYLLYFASQTYNEAFFLMLQAIFFYFTFKYFFSDIIVPKIKHYAIVGFLLFLMSLTKNIAFASVIAFFGFLLITGKWKALLNLTGSFLLFFLSWEGLKRIIWKESTVQFSSQGNSLLYKDFYNPSRGKEDLMGFFQRIIDNGNLYLSKHFYKFLSLRSEESNDILPFLTVIIVMLIIVGLFWAFRNKNKILLFVGIYLVSILLFTFLILQKQWDQWRLIIIIFPLMLLFILSTIYYTFKSESFKSLQFLLPVFSIILFLTTFNTTSKSVKLQSDILSKNLEGNILYGLTPDWQNFILMSKWAAKNTPPEYMIASRKPDISFIYGERKFYGISKVPTMDIDSIIRKNNPDSLVYTIFHIKKLAESQARADLKYRGYLQGVISGTFSFGSTEVDESNYIGIYALPKDKLQEMRKDPQIKNIVKEEPDVLGWVNKLKKENADIAIVQPDYLYSLLKKSKVKYALLASLRLNPNINSGSIITTIHRYMYFIQLKYPDAFNEIQTIGTEEKCSLIEIRLE
jgi:hypothetical protein